MNATGAGRRRSPLARSAIRRGQRTTRRVGRIDPYPPPFAPLIGFADREPALTPPIVVRPFVWRVLAVVFVVGIHPRPQAVLLLDRLLVAAFVLFLAFEPPPFRAGAPSACETLSSLPAQSTRCAMLSLASAFFCAKFWWASKAP